MLAGALGGRWATAEVAGPLGRPVRARWLLLPDGTAVVESAEAIGLALVAAAERDPLRASSRGVGELMLAAIAGGARALLVGVGGTATVDGGAGLLEAVGAQLEGMPLRVACDVSSPLLGEPGAARVFCPQKGAGPAAVEELERRLAGAQALEPFRDLPGAGAGGGIGAALASLGGELVSGAELVLDTIGFDERAARADLVVTGEGTVDATTHAGKAPGVVVARCKRLGVRCELFGGLVRDGVHAHALSGDPTAAAVDLERLGEQLARSF